MKVSNVVFGLVLTGVVGPVNAQCEPEWDTALGNPGITTGYIEPIVAWDDGTGQKLYVGGSAENIGGGAANDYLAQFDPMTGQWSRVGLGIDNGCCNAFLTTICPWDDGSGEQLYIGGQFDSAGNAPDTVGFARWDGENWSTVNAQLDPNGARVVYDLLPANLGDGEKLYIAGNFQTIGSLPQATGLAVYDGEAFATFGTGAGFAPWGGFSPFVAGLEEWDDGSGTAIYACGRFLGLDNAQTTNVARYRAATGTWESFGQAIQPTSVVGNMTSWAVFDDGDGEALYLGGQTFRVAGDSRVYVVAKWDGANWTGVGQTLSGRVTDLEVWNDGAEDALYLSGTATFEVNYFARLVGSSWIPAVSGVNNPPVNGNFASAFGLGFWGNQLVVGGNFTQVGGFDPVTGVGMGDPLPARGLAALTPCAQCACDWNGDADLDSDDFFAFLEDFLVAGDADYNNDGDTDSDDFFDFLQCFLNPPEEC